MKKLKNKLPISVIVCVLNEDSNVLDCLNAIKKNNPAEIIVVDGGSTDKTIEIAEKITDKVVKVRMKGLGYQRKIGVEKASQKYLAMVDADNRLGKDTLKLLIEELESKGYDGLQAQILSTDNESYWDLSMEKMLKLVHNVPGPRIVIGAPAVYKSMVLKKINYDPFFIGADEDTDLCLRLVNNKYKIGIGTAIIKQKHRTDFSSFLKKWFWYGRGDARFIKKHPSRFFAILLHLLYNYPIKKSIFAIRKKRPEIVPFLILCGLTRFCGITTEYATLLLKGKKSEIYST